MTLPPRDLKNIRAAANHPKGTIKPYDRGRLEDTFKATYFKRLAEIEHEIAATKEENVTLAGAIAADRETVEERKIRLDDRTIALMSFSAVINFYARFLELRQVNASLKLIDPLDYGENSEVVIQHLEDSVANLESRLDLGATTGQEAQIRSEDKTSRSLAEKIQLRRVYCRWASCFSRIARSLFPVSQTYIYNSLFAVKHPVSPCQTSRNFPGQ
jgi:hypothetical protein